MAQHQKALSAILEEHLAQQKVPWKAELVFPGPVSHNGSPFKENVDIAWYMDHNPVSDLLDHRLYFCKTTYPVDHATTSIGWRKVTAGGGWNKLTRDIGNGAQSGGYVITRLAKPPIIKSPCGFYFSMIHPIS